MTSTYYFCLVLATIGGWAYSTSYDYKVHVYTGDKTYAGMNADVKMKFYDNTGKLQMVESIFHANSRHPFSRNDHDVGQYELKKYIGRISSISIKRGSTWNVIGDYWHLQKVAVEDPLNGYLYEFNCKCWIKDTDWRTLQGSLGCKNGYLLSNGKCIDVDECEQGAKCEDINAICTNTHGSYHCKKCRDGYRYGGTKCQDINECSERTSKCADICTNTIGGYVCACYPGFKLINQFQCTDIDECQQQKCDPRATCVNKPGKYTCICPTGYENINDKCTNIDECARGNDCDRKTSLRCTDYDGGYKCICKPGFYNEKDSMCKDINECQGRNTCEQQSSDCENLEGTYRCNCLPGYVMSVDGKSCSPRICYPLNVPNGAMVYPPRCAKRDSNSYTDVCTISCTAGYKISDPSHSKLTCGQHASWEGTVPTCKPVSCSSLPSPNNGRTIPSSCTSGGKYKQKCSFLCDDGYTRDGADEAVCQADGRWSVDTPSCKKVITDAWIRCPQGISTDLKSGESTANIRSMWKLPKTSLNAKNLISSHKKDDRFPVGITVVTWTVSSDNNRQINCSFAVRVYDKERPVAVDCPKQPLPILTTKDKELVHLTKVKFTDNVAVKSVEYSLNDPAELKIGTHVVNVIGKDTSGNMGYCMYRVIVRGKGCGQLDRPVDGDLSCNSIIGSHFCQVTCRGDKVVFNATGQWGARTWYCLENDEIKVWKPTPNVPDCVDYTKYDGTSCPAGKVLIQTTLPESASSVVNVCGACPSGKFYENNECKECPAGTYQDTTGNNGVVSCKKCGPNTSSKPGSTKNVDCKALCSPGYYSADGFQPCKLCKRGEYQPIFGSNSCNKCPQGRSCTRHEASIAIESCGRCPAIDRVVPSGNVRRLLGSDLELSCYMHTTDGQIASDKIKWDVNFDTAGKSLSGASVKKLYDLDFKQIGLQLKVRDLKVYYTGTYECIVENQFGEDRKSVRVTVVDAQGSGFGPLNADE